MHRFATKSLLRRLRFSSLILLIFPFLVLTLIGMLGWGFLNHDTELLQLSLKYLGACLGVMLLLAMVGFSIRCPLCRGTLIKRPSCSIHPRAERTFGSVRLRVATQVLFRGRFRCPYCAEHCDATTPRRR